MRTRRDQAPAPIRRSRKWFAWQCPARAPYVTYTIIAVTVIFYLLQMASCSMSWGRISWLPTAPAPMKRSMLGKLWRFLTPALLHASIPHILFNMYALFTFGTGLERHFGHGRFLLLYVLCAYTGNVVSFLLSAGYSVGASTAIFGLLGAEAVFLLPKPRNCLPDSSGRAIRNIIFMAMRSI